MSTPRHETTTVTAADGLTYQVDPNGFPVEPCNRCSTRGTIPAYHSNHGGVCFNCHGAGWVHPKTKAGQIAADWSALARNTNIGADDVQSGMTIRPQHRKGEPAPWRTVAWVKTTARVTACRIVNGEPDYTTAGREVVVRYTDGTVDRLWCESLEARADVDAAETARQAMSATARDLHERALRRKATRAAKPTA